MAGAPGRFVFGNDSQGFFASVKNFHRADDDALKGIAAGAGHTGFASGLARDWGRVDRNSN